MDVVVFRQERDKFAAELFAEIRKGRLRQGWSFGDGLSFEETEPRWLRAYRRVADDGDAAASVRTKTIRMTEIEPGTLIVVPRQPSDDQVVLLRSVAAPGHGPFSCYRFLAPLAGTNDFRHCVFVDAASVRVVPLANIEGPALDAVTTGAFQGPVTFVRKEKYRRSLADLAGRVGVPRAGNTGPEASRGEYIARLCWNSDAWRQPTGESPKLESGSYATEHGFGHEEWLGRSEWILDDEWRYGFLQPVNHARSQLEGRVLDVALYARAPDGRRFYVGQLHRCEVLTVEQARTAVAAFAKRGWLDQMEREVEAVKGKIAGLDRSKPEIVLNVRFRPADLEWFEPYREARPDDRVHTLNRYILTARKATDSRAWHRPSKGTRTPRPTTPNSRSGSAGGPVDAAHNRIQNHLFALLSAKYGEDAVVMEEGFVDVRVRHAKLDALIEVKSSANALGAIREAIGQILEYALHAPADIEDHTVLIVAAPGMPTAESTAYMDTLNRRLAIPLRYVCATEDMGIAPL